MLVADDNERFDATGSCIVFDAASVSSDKSHSEERKNAHGPPSNPKISESSPDVLIQQEDRALLLVKILFLLVLVAAAGVTATFIYIYTKESQARSFRSDFSLISRAIAESLVDDTAFFFNAGQSVATTLTVLMQAYNQSQTTFSIPLSTYRAISNGIGAKATYVTWNPLLRDNEEREQFERMVAARESEGFFSEGAIVPCFVCGDENMAPSTPDVELEFPGVGRWTCDATYQAGLQGVMPAAVCPSVSEAVIDTCSCRQVEDRGPAKEKVRSPSDGLYRLSGNGNETILDEPWSGGPYLPMWIDWTVIAARDPVLFNHLSHVKSAKAVASMLASGYPQVTEMYNSSESSYFSKYSEVVSDSTKGPASNMFYPVRSSDGTDIAGAVSFVISWQSLLRKEVSKNGVFAIVVIESSCGEIHTYRVKEEGSGMTWLGTGDLHDDRYNHMMHQTLYETFDYLRLSFVDTTERPENKSRVESCNYRFAVYPTEDFESQYITTLPWISAVVIIVVFIFTSALFILYDYIVRRRQAKIMKSAKQTNDIVSSLFPDTFRDRLYEQISAASPDSRKTAMSSFLAGSAQGSVFGSEPIADFFPSCTVIFIDIANFTAWCSERDPSQVFILLENLYHAFDKVAEQLGIFKVETIGDSYVAVCGLPTPRDDHAAIMTRFAFLCLCKMRRLVKSLEVDLGPSTGDLVARCGIHSGPVTAGVLRGTKARFQLFGDTVNTASRMESSGVPSRIHASEQTVSLLKKSSKSSWVIPRDGTVDLKGKGRLQTYWLDPRRQRWCSVSSAITGESLEKHSISMAWDSDAPPDLVAIENATKATCERLQRLIDWNVEVLFDLLTRVATQREALRARAAAPGLSADDVEPHAQEVFPPSNAPSLGNRRIIDEMTEVISLPKFDPSLYREPKQIVLRETVRAQLREYVSQIAHSYRDVPFHNFEHASHVILSATKLMKRIMSPEGVENGMCTILNEEEREIATARQIRDELGSTNAILRCFRSFNSRRGSHWLHQQRVG
jgi:class 3 adenylate cyclase